MNMQAKTSEQIMREALETIGGEIEDAYCEGIPDGYKIGKLSLEQFIDKTLEEADHAVNGKAIVDNLFDRVYELENRLEEADEEENVSEQSNRELKRYFDGEAIGRAEVLQEVIERIKIKKEDLPIHLENMLKKKPSTNSKEDDEMFMDLIIGASYITLDFVLDLLESELR